MRQVLLSAALLTVVNTVGAQSTSGSISSHLPHAISAEQNKAARKPATVSLKLDNQTVSQVIAELGRLAKTQVIFNVSQPEFAKKISVDIKSKSALVAFREALEGTGLNAVLAADGETIVISPSREIRSKDSVAEKGKISGRIIDSTTNAGIEGVTIAIGETKIRSVTDANGNFTASDVPFGDHVLSIRVWGYGTATRLVTVSDTETVLRIHLSPVVTTLGGVVTTASGMQRKIEVGNDITLLNVDSIIRTAPVPTISDLLVARVPGLTAARESGALGAQTRLRLRGISSATVSNDPIVILDGVRIQGPETSEYSPTTVNTSRLDDIDVNTIESIEVLKGPSASTLYGTDAANGVIVITSKRGTTGKTRWSLGGNRTGMMAAPRPFQGHYVTWGVASDSETPIPCTLQDIAVGQCVRADSVSVYNLLTREDTRTTDNGGTQALNAGISTGGQNLQMYLGSSVMQGLGGIKMPDVERRRAERILGRTLPSWVVDPNTQKSINGTARITSQPSRSVDINLTTNLIRQNTMNGGDGLAILAGLQQFTDSDTLGGLGGSRTGITRTLIEKKTEDVNRIVVSATTAWRPRSFINIGTSVGIDRAEKENQNLKPAEFAISGLIDCGAQCYGERTLTKTASNMFSGSMYATSTVPLSQDISARLSLGSQYNKTTINESTLHGWGSPAWNSHLYTNSEAQTSTAGTATAGWYLDGTVTLFRTLFVTSAFRRDAGSTFGYASRLPYYPKVSASWLAYSDGSERGLQLPEFLNAINNIRFRFAFGQSGVQPTAIMTLPGYTQGNSFIDAASHASLFLSSLGNSSIRPERSGEIELGVDFGAWNDRLSGTITHYRKTSKDALISTTLPTSVGLPNLSQSRNVGSVLNRGFEATLNGIVVDSRTLTWNSSLIGTWQHNRLLTLAPGMSTMGTSASYFRVGYPLFSTWTRPIIGFYDFNGDGVLTNVSGANEIILGDSNVFLGGPLPKYELSWSNNFSLMNGAVSLSTLINYQRGITASQPANLANREGLASIDASTADKLGALYSGGAQKVNALRFNSASVSYILPMDVVRQLKAERISLTASASNLGLWSKFRGVDPHIFSGERLVDNGRVPPTRNYQLGFNIQL